MDESDWYQSLLVNILTIVALSILLMILSSLNGIVGIHAHYLGRYFLLGYINALIGLFIIFFVAVLLQRYYNEAITLISGGNIIILCMHAHIVALLWNIPYMHTLILSSIIAAFIMLLFYFIIKYVNMYATWLIGRKIY